MTAHEKSAGDEWRKDFTLFLKRLDELRQLIERQAEEGQKERAADQKLLYALVKDHHRRIRARERLERLQRRQAPTQEPADLRHRRGI